MSVVQLDFFAPNDVNGAVIATMTDEDDFFEGLELWPRLRGLGGGRIVTSRQLGFAAITNGVIDAEVFVRVLIPAVSETKYVWGFFLDLRHQQIVSRDEKAGERFILGGLGPLFYLHRAILWDEQFSGEGWRIDTDNGVFRFEEDDTVGNILRRLQREDQDNTITRFLPDLTYGFDNTQDSAGNAWGAEYTFSSEFELPIGGNYLEHVWAVQEAVSEPLEYTMDLGSVGAPVLRMDAWQSYGRDLTGSVFGPGVVLIREGVNIESDFSVTQGSHRYQSQGSGTSTRKASHVLVRGLDGVYGRAVRTSWDPGEYAKAVMIDYPRTAHEPTLERAGKRWLRRQSNADNEFELAIAPGFDESAGRYMPGPDGTDGHVWLGDTVTLKTGDDPTSSWLDFQYEPQWVTGIDLVLDEAARDDTDEDAALSWHVGLLLNVERNSDNQQKDGGEGGGRHSHGANPQLCVPAGASTSAVVVSSAGKEGAAVETFAFTVADEADTAIYAAILTTKSPAGGADVVEWGPGYVNEGTKGTTEPLTLIATLTHPSYSTFEVQIWRLLSPSPSTQATSALRFAVPNQESGHFGYWFVRGVHQTIPESATATDDGAAASSSSVTVAAAGGDLVLDVAGWAQPNVAAVAPSATAGQAETWALAQNASFGINDVGSGGGYGSSATPTWNFTNAYAYTLAAAVAVAGSSSGGLTASVNDGHADLVGTSKRAARCDHRHDVHRDRAPTVNDDWATAGYKLGTIWAQLDSLAAPTAIVGVWMLVDITEGAAVWAEWPTGSGGSHPDLATHDSLGLATDAELAAHAAAADPHTGYVREADADWVDLTDGGETALHSHAGGGGATDLDDLTDVDTTTAAPNDGDVLTFDTSSGLWTPAAPSGGGGGGAEFDVIAAMLGTPDTAYEFDSSSLAGWTQLGAGTPTNENADTTVPGHYYLQLNSGAFLFVGRYQAMPSAPFTVVSKVLSQPSAQYQAAGIFLGEATPGFMEMIIHAGEGNVRRVSVERHTPTAANSIITSGSMYSYIESPVYMAIRVNSATDVDYLMSMDGRIWRTMTNARSPTSTPGSVGMLLKCQSAVVHTAAFDYFRIWNSALTLPGST